MHLCSPSAQNNTPKQYFGVYPLPAAHSILPLHSAIGRGSYCRHRVDRMISNEFEAESDPGKPVAYQIRIKGHLGHQWTDWYEGLAITQEENGETLLAGSVADQTALHGLLKRVRDLGMPLLSVNRIEPGQPGAAGSEPFRGSSSR